MKSLLVLFSVAGCLWAKDACEHPSNDFDGMYCLNQGYMVADRALNDSYGKLIKKLDAAGKAKLKSGQLGWIRERNGACSDSTDKGFFVNLDCATQSTIARTQFLQSRLNECAKGICLVEKL